MNSAATQEGLRLLVVDDDDEHRALLVTDLRGRGYVVAEAASGDELLDLLFALPRDYFDMVICDQMMPGLRGTECLARASARARFIIVTGSSDPRVEESARRFGASGFVRKPLALDELVELVESSRTEDRGSGVQRIAAEPSDGDD